jgi:hypothetical protein
MRHADWQTRYHAAIKTASIVPFTWGTHDCVTFAAYVADCIADGAIMKKVQERYSWSSEVEAYAIIQRVGSLKLLIEEFMGLALPWSKCAVGDPILAIQSGGKEILGVQDGHNLLVPASIGIEGLSLHSAVCGWRVE